MRVVFLTKIKEDVPQTRDHIQKLSLDEEAYKLAMSSDGEMF